jgi:two-component system LytT family response regulator
MSTKTLDIQAQPTITIPLVGDNLYLELSEVAYLEGCRNYTYIHVNKQKILSARTLRFYEKQVLDYLFIRVHKSYCINIDHISSINFRTRIITLNSAVEVPFARSKKKFLKHIFNASLAINP